MVSSMDYTALADAFWKKGFLILPGFFAPELMDHLDSLIQNHFGTDPAYEHSDEFLEKSRVDVVPWFPQQDGIPDFDAVENDHRLEGLTRAILGEGWGRQYCMVMFSKQGSNGQSWHQDCPPENVAEHNLNRLVYTREITAAQGGQLAVVPGSHLRGEIPPGDPMGAFDGQVVYAPGRGDLVLLHGHAWHRVLPSTGGSRSSTNFRSAPTGTPEGITDICVYRNMRYRFSTSEVIAERV